MKVKLLNNDIVQVKKTGETEWLCSYQGVDFVVVKGWFRNGGWGYSLSAKGKTQWNDGKTLTQCIRKIIFAKKHLS